VRRTLAEIFLREDVGATGSNVGDDEPSEAETIETSGVVISLVGGGNLMGVHKATCRLGDEAPQ